MLLFWVAVIAGAGFSYMGLKKGFLSMWAISFNVLISTYLCVMLMPVVAMAISGGGESYYYSCALCMLIIGALVFALMQTIASNYFSGGFQVTFPKLFDNIGAAVLGFMSGYLVCCTLILIVSIMPLSNYSFLEGTLSPNNLPDSVSKPVVGACDFIGRISIQTYPERAGAKLKEFIDERERALRNDYNYTPHEPTDGY